MKTSRIRSLRVLGAAIALMAVLAPGARAAGESFIPGYTDFPNHLRVADDRAIPGYTDFPNHLRVESVYDRARVHSGADGRVVTVSSPDRGFQWDDAALGASSAALALFAAAIAASLVRRPLRRVAATG